MNPSVLPNQQARAGKNRPHPGQIGPDGRGQFRGAHRTAGGPGYRSGNRRLLGSVSLYRGTVGRRRRGGTAGMISYKSTGQYPWKDFIFLSAVN